MAAGALLTTLDHVKSWLDIAPDNTDADDLLNRLIKSASAFVLNYINCSSIGPVLYNEWYDGGGKNFMLLRQYPVLSVAALSFAGTPIAAATGNGITQQFTNGYVLEDPGSDPSGNYQRLILYGYGFPRSRSSVYVSYMAGYQVTAEVQVVPGPVNPATVSLVTTDQTWTSNVAVTLEDGTPLTLILTGDPDPGEYLVSATGVYTFNAGLEDDVVLITYGYVPSDIEQAVWELVGARYKYKDRIGYSSKSLGGQETVAFDVKSMDAYTRELLVPYRRVVPI